MFTFYPGQTLVIFWDWSRGPWWAKTKGQILLSVDERDHQYRSVFTCSSLVPPPTLHPNSRQIIATYDQSRPTTGNTDQRCQRYTFGIRKQTRARTQVIQLLGGFEHRGWQHILITITNLTPDITKSFPYRGM